MSRRIYYAVPHLVHISLLQSFSSSSPKPENPLSDQLLEAQAQPLCDLKLSRRVVKNIYSLTDLSFMEPTVIPWTF